MKNKLKSILEKNAKRERETPYNFCDRWCDRCHTETQHRCKLYLDELDRRVTNIAHGRDEDDTEIYNEEMEKYSQLIEESIEDSVPQEEMENFELTVESIDEEAIEEFEQKRQEQKKHPLMKVSHQYCLKVHELLKHIYFDKTEQMPASVKFQFETITWYHTLLPAKIYRALCGIYVKDIFDDDDYELYDGIAQLEVCKKAIRQSDNALRKIVVENKSYQLQITELLAILHNIKSQIHFIEKDI